MGILVIFDLPGAEGAENFFFCRFWPISGKIFSIGCSIIVLIGIVWLLVRIF